jgi:hypothetical protein
MATGKKWQMPLANRKREGSALAASAISMRREPTGCFHQARRYLKGSENLTSRMNKVLMLGLRFTAMKIQVTVFWVTTTCSNKVGYQCF